MIESGDTTFDMQARGQQVRCLNNAQFFEHGRRQLHVQAAEAQQKITKISKSIMSVVDDLTKKNERLKYRIDQLEREGHNTYSGDPPYNEHIIVNRKDGTVRGDR